MDTRIGASGARIAVTLLHELQKRDGRYGLATLCIGGGMGEATIFERTVLQVKKMETIRIEQKRGYCEIKLNRPGQRNALNRRMLVELREAVSMLRERKT